MDGWGLIQGRGLIQGVGAYCIQSQKHGGLIQGGLIQGWGLIQGNTVIETKEKANFQYH